MEIKMGLLPNASNYRQGRSADIKYIVIHYTANKGDTAFNNIKYFHNNAVKASAHFFVDEDNIYTSVPIGDTAWHCGGGLQGKGGHSWFGKCTNNNSIGIEMCLIDKSGNVRKGTMLKAVELVRYLMNEYSVPHENVIRHWDVTGKNCPAPFVGNNNVYWEDFKNRIESEEELTMGQFEELKSMLVQLSARVEDIAQENNRQNNIIDLVGKDIQNIAKTLKTLDELKE